MIKLKGMLKFKWKSEGNIVSEGYWDTVNSLCIFKKLKLVLENSKVSLSAPKKTVKSRIIKSIKRIIDRLNVNNLLLMLTSGYFHNILKPILNHVIK